MLDMVRRGVLEVRDDELVIPAAGEESAKRIEGESSVALAAPGLLMPMPLMRPTQPSRLTLNAEQAARSDTTLRLLRMVATAVGRSAAPSFPFWLTNIRAIS